MYAFNLKLNRFVDLFMLYCNNLGQSNGQLMANLKSQPNFEALRKKTHWFLAGILAFFYNGLPNRLLNKRNPGHIKS